MDAKSAQPEIVETRECEHLPGASSYRLRSPRVSGWLTLLPDAYGWPDEPTGRRVRFLTGLPAAGSTVTGDVAVTDSLTVNGIPIGNIAPMDTDQAALITEGEHSSFWKYHVRRQDDDRMGAAPDVTARRTVLLAAHAVRAFASREDFADKVRQVDIARAPHRIRRLTTDLGLARAEVDTWGEHMHRIETLIHAQEQLLDNTGDDALKATPPWPARHTDLRSLEPHVRTSRPAEDYLRRLGRIDFGHLRAVPTPSPMEG